jgi:large subunit ribosomal protein L4
MDIQVKKLAGGEAGKVSVNEAVFGLDPRLDIISRVIRWQNTMQAQGSANTLTRSEVTGTTKKPFKQKGTGSARQGSLKGPHQTGGGRIHGPKPRCMHTSLNKKIRQLGTKHALSLKIKEGGIIVVDNFDFAEISTKKAAEIVKSHGIYSAVFIGCPVAANNFRTSMRNVARTQFVPDFAVNARSILRFKNVVIAKDSIKIIEEKLA